MAAVLFSCCKISAIAALDGWDFELASPGVDVFSRLWWFMWLDDELAAAAAAAALSMLFKLRLLKRC